MIIDKQYLMDTRDAVQEINELKQCIKAFCYDMHIYKLNGMPGIKNRINDPTADRAQLKTDLEILWEDKIKELEKRIKVVEKEMVNLKPIHRRILRYYYFRGMTDDRIAKVFHRSRQGICNSRTEAEHYLFGIPYKRGNVRPYDPKNKAGRKEDKIKKSGE